jgi:hypothetical protein
MVKRILDAAASDFAEMKASDLEESIAKSEGRTLCCEVVSCIPCLVDGVTQSELVVSVGADLVVLNVYDVNRPVIFNLPGQAQWSSDITAWVGSAEQGVDPIKKLKHLIGRPVGINLEPSTITDEAYAGRLATADNALKALEQGADFVFITGNPAAGTTNQMIAESTHEIREAVKNEMFIVAGKCHGAGVLDEQGSKLINVDDVKSFCEAGANAVAMPMPGALPGWTVEMVHELVEVAHEFGKLGWLVMDHAIEGAQKQVIAQLAINATMTGADVFEIGDAGLGGVPLPENILEFSLAIRGRRHTYRRMSLSPHR